MLLSACAYISTGMKQVPNSEVHLQRDVCIKLNCVMWSVFYLEYCPQTDGSGRLLLSIREHHSTIHGRNFAIARRWK